MQLAWACTARDMTQRVTHAHTHAHTFPYGHSGFFMSIFSTQLYCYLYICTIDTNL
eukprot:COSAG03_NODE_28998_length_191_cov_87.250000_1_plen_55_part_10